jgi:hypothetical protein
MRSAARHTGASPAPLRAAATLEWANVIRPVSLPHSSRVTTTVPRQFSHPLVRRTFEATQTCPKISAHRPTASRALPSPSRSGSLLGRGKTAAAPSCSRALRSSRRSLGANLPRFDGVPPARQLVLRNSLRLASGRAQAYARPLNRYMKGSLPNRARARSSAHALAAALRLATAPCHRARCRPLPGRRPLIAARFSRLRLELSGMP